MFDIQNLSFSYNGKDNVISNLSLSIEQGDFMGITGANGAGKTTLFNILTGINTNYHGSIKLYDKELSAISGIQRAMIIALLPQETNITHPITGLELVLMGRIPHARRLFERQSDIDVAIQIMKLTGSFEFANIAVTDLSGGQKKKVLMAKTLAQQPQLLLLDEPLTSLDATSQKEIMELLRRLNSENKLTIMITGHDENIMKKYCTRTYDIKNTVLGG